MSQVVFRLQPSVHAAYRAQEAQVGTSVVSVYNTLQEIEPRTSAALVRYSAHQLAPLIAQLGGDRESWCRAIRSSLSMAIVLQQVSIGLRCGAGLTPICIKLSRFVFLYRLLLGAILLSITGFVQQLLTRLSFPFLFAQQGRHGSPKITAQRLEGVLLDSLSKASFAFQPQNKLRETDFAGVRPSWHTTQQRNKSASPW